MPPLKVLFIASYPYMPQRTSGAESSIHELCVGLLERGHQVAVLAGLHKYDTTWLKNRLLSTVQNSDLVADRCFDYPVYRVSNLRGSISPLVDKFQPDIIVVMAGRCFGLLNECTALRIPTIYYALVLGLGENDETLNRSPYLKCISNSQFTANVLQKLLHLPSTVIPHRILFDNYRVAGKGTKAVHIGINHKKGIHISIQLARSLPRIPFLFVESWPLTRSEFKAIRQETESLSNVTIMRRTNNMKKVYSQAKVLLAPSQWEECWGRVATEAQISGIPVLASDSGGLTEAVGPGGIIVGRKEPLHIWKSALMEIWHHHSYYQQAALEHSQRDEIAPAYLLEFFLSILYEHIEGV